MTASSPSSAASPPANSQILRKRRKSQQNLLQDAARTPKTPLADTPQYIESPFLQNEAQTPAAHQESDEEIEDEDWGATQISQVLEGTSKEEESAQMAMLMNKFTTEQMSRYEAFRRGNLNKTAVKKVVNQMLAQNVTANIPIVVAGFGKVFVGEIVEKGICDSF
ncbi:Transcription initiation factor TFIID subunit 11 [Neolecta irregularis DAH-3]|uniref:Transcription initiation factor TFIID subunit 11 n=1 Tax=Neolecta irregularis (strain DAH-3) TaxID=1198029 RepID=A0A1U7LUQ6_NEOID|nr:Transcription initiation factor TFIID subunit 11 [Neolecta irregularis DAH-3]|eukprot:OLL26348.1 Transcription initiation factor TFIID subunit 11 [Neolecta irregularis DAH-3]